VGPVPKQPANRGKRRESEPQPKGLTQGTALPPVGGRDHRPLQHVPDAAKVVFAITSQAEGRFGEFLLQHPRTEFDDQVRLDLPGVPQTVGGLSRHRQLLAGAKLEARPVDRKRRGSRDHREARFLDRMEVGIADAAAGREPGLVLDQLALRFGGSLQKADPFAVEGVLDDRTDDGRRHLDGLFCGV